MSSDERFASFVRTQTDALLKTAYLLTRNGPDAEELVQDTLVWLYPRWAQVEAAEHQLAYVRKAVVNRFLAGRRRMSSTEVHLDDGSEVFSERSAVHDQADALTRPRPPAQSAGILANQACEQLRRRRCPLQGGPADPARQLQLLWRPYLHLIS